MGNKKVYIAGKMTGCENYNFEAFDKAEDKLIKAGLKPYNPAHFGRAWVTLEEVGFIDYLNNAMGTINRLNYDMLEQCDYIYLIDGWEDSQGAKAELMIHLRANKAVLTEHSDLSKLTDIND